MSITNGVPANSCPYIWNFASAPRAYLSTHGGNEIHAHTCTHIQNTGYTHTRTHDTATNYYYSTITTTATITTIIGCLSIRLTPSSGPNYYVTIFIDNKRRNKYWNNNCNKKKRKKEGQMTFRRLSRHIGISILLFRDSISDASFVYPEDWQYTRVPFFSVTVPLVDSNWLIYSLFGGETKDKSERNEIKMTPLFLSTASTG